MEEPMNQASEPKNGPVLVLLGGTGDLARRMLLPSLFHLEADGLLPEGLRIYGVARDGQSPDTYRTNVRAALDAREKSVDEEVWKRFIARVDYHSGDVTKPEGAQKLAEAIGDHSQLFIYFSVSPSIYPNACESLAAAGLIGSNTRLVLEKPIGRDLESSKALNH